MGPDEWVALLAAEEGHQPSRFAQLMRRRGARALFVVGSIAAVLLVVGLGLVVLSRFAE